jgi:hypothetical protein
LGSSFFTLTDRFVYHIADLTRRLVAILPLTPLTPMASFTAGVSAIIVISGLM